MALPSVYSTDNDLLLYSREVATLFPLLSQHQDAADEVQRRLRDKGLDDDDLEDLSAQTVADLKKVCCFYVLQLAYLDVDLEKAKFYLDRFESTWRLLRIEVDTDADGTAEEDYSTGGELSLG